MEQTNIGIANLIISNKLKESYFSDNLINESKKIASDFFEVVKNSPVLQLEFKVFNNIEGKHISDDMFAKQYIDNNIKLFEVYTLEEIEEEHVKLSAFLQEDIVAELANANYDLEKINLYNSINTLITESLKISDNVDVDGIHEAFTLIFNHIKEPKQTLVESVEQESVDEEVIEIAVGKFNQKYESLDEGDRDLLKTLIKSNDNDKKIMLESYKTEVLTILEGIDEKKAQDNISKAILKIKEMVYSQKNVDDNIIGLHEFKKELL